MKYLALRRSEEVVMSANAGIEVRFIDVPKAHSGPVESGANF
jgi:hypothetical protein